MAKELMCQITYTNAKGENVHSDLPHTPEYREVLHDVLNEWLDKAGNTGFFFIGDFTELSEWVNDV
jgi:hypothetical protein